MIFILNNYTKLRYEWQFDHFCWGKFLIGPSSTYPEDFPEWSFHSALPSLFLFSVSHFSFVVFSLTYFISPEEGQRLLIENSRTIFILVVTEVKYNHHAPRTTVELPFKYHVVTVKSNEVRYVLRKNVSWQSIIRFEAVQSWFAVKLAELKWKTMSPPYMHRSNTVKRDF